MKKSVLYIMVLMMGTVLFSSCCTTKVSSIVKTKKPVTSEIIADLDIRAEKVSYTYHTVVKADAVVSELELRETAVFEALKTVGADVLVAPQYQVSRKKCKRIKTYEVTVTGYPAFYVNMRQMPVAEKLELRELKEGTSYVIVKQSAAGKDIEIDRDLVTTPQRKVAIDLEEREVEKVVMTGKERK